ncbi:MAG: STAS domain-containing protein [Planctomycetota bacterium]|jgi:anti-anti-sigma regulatory factor|nr:STAS domain-containing protein [Planctomycetota bacterium]
MTPGTHGTSTPTFVTVSVKNKHMIARLDAVSIGPREAALIATEVSRMLTSSTKGKCLVIDLSRTNSLSSMGLGLCVDLRNRAVDAGLRPVLAGMNIQLTDLVRMMRVDRLFTITSSSHDLERLLL